MARLVVLEEGKKQDEWSLDAREVTVGRDPGSDLRLSDPAVSRHHARLLQIYNNHYLEDLGSTNGVLLNGRRIRKHILKDGDLIQIGKHELRYLSETSGDSGDDPDKTVVIQPLGGHTVAPPADETPPPVSLEDKPAAAAGPEIPRPNPFGGQPAAAQGHRTPQPLSVRKSASRNRAYVRYLSGTERGQSRILEKSLFTIGQPGGNLAVIARRTQGFFLLHLGGEQFSTVNGKPVHGPGVQLANGDVIDVGGERLVFQLDS